MASRQPGSAFLRSTAPGVYSDSEIPSGFPAEIFSWDESKHDHSTSFAPYKIYNIGNNKPVPLMRFIKALESALGNEAQKIYMEMQPGDVLRTYADVSDLESDINFKPETSIEAGIEKFVAWYQEYYQ